MAHSQERRQRYAILLALLFSLGTASATVMTVHHASPVVTPLPADNSLTAAKDPFLSGAAATDYAWHDADAQALNNLAAAAGGATAKSLVDYPYTSVAAGQAEDLGEVIRHRGFGKALLIIIACGALIRLLTSPAYLKYIADVLDPKAF